MFQVDKIPDEFRSIIVEHVVHVHMSVSRYTAEFLLRLRRQNYVTPKHYMDYLTNYIALLNEKDAFIIAQVIFSPVYFYNTYSIFLYVTNFCTIFSFISYGSKPYSAVCCGFLALIWKPNFDS